MDHRIVFVGGGNMATSLVSGLRQADCPGDRITVIEPEPSRSQRLAERYGVHVRSEADAATLGTADAIVLAVKPQVMREVCLALASPLAAAAPLVVSVAAGVPLAALRQWLGEAPGYVRAMPNTPALIGAGASGLYAAPEVDAAGRRLAETIVGSAGLALWVDSEDRLDAVTATSGSGPAYFFAFMEAMQAGAIDLGLDADSARQLVLHTALGAARMAQEAGEDIATLRANVTSPGGTTEAALTHFAEGDLDALVQRAMQAAAGRAHTLGQTLIDDPDPKD